MTTPLERAIDLYTAYPLGIYPADALSLTDRGWKLLRGDKAHRSFSSYKTPMSSIVDYFGKKSRDRFIEVDVGKKKKKKKSKPIPLPSTVANIIGGTPWKNVHRKSDVIPVRPPPKPKPRPPVRDTQPELRIIPVPRKPNGQVPLVPSTGEEFAPNPAPRKPRPRDSIPPSKTKNKKNYSWATTKGQYLVPEYRDSKKNDNRSYLTPVYVNKISKSTMPRPSWKTRNVSRRSRTIQPSAKVSRVSYSESLGAVAANAQGTFHLDQVGFADSPTCLAEFRENLEFRVIIASCKFESRAADDVAGQFCLCWDDRVDTLAPIGSVENMQAIGRTKVGRITSNQRISVGPSPWLRCSPMDIVHPHEFGRFCWLNTSASEIGTLQIDATLEFRHPDRLKYGASASGTHTLTCTVANMSASGMLHHGGTAFKATEPQLNTSTAAYSAYAIAGNYYSKDGNMKYQGISVPLGSRIWFRTATRNADLESLDGAHTLVTEVSLSPHFTRDTAIHVIMDSADTFVLSDCYLITG